MSSSNFASGDPQGGMVPPSAIGYERGEQAMGIPSSLRMRAFQQQHQPTIANSMGMHSLPPVSLRSPVPLSDQYAIGIARPDLSTSIPDPTIYKSINGNVALGSSYDARTKALANLRTTLQQQRRQRGQVLDTY